MMPCLFVTLHWCGGTAPHRSVESVHNHPERGKTENLWLNVARWLRNWTERLQVRTPQGMTYVLWPLTKLYFEECFNSFCPYNAVLDHTDFHCMDIKKTKKKTGAIMQNIFFWDPQKKMPYRSGTRVNDDRIVVFGVNYSFKQEKL